MDNNAFYNRDIDSDDRFVSIDFTSSQSKSKETRKYPQYHG